MKKPRMRHVAAAIAFSYTVMAAAPRMPGDAAAGLVFATTAAAAAVLLVYRGLRATASMRLFMVAVYALSISYAYELLSPYPIGQDVHDEVFVASTFMKDPSAPILQHHIYYTVKLLISLYASAAAATGLPLHVVVKYAAATIIGLIPVFLYPYIERLSRMLGSGEAAAYPALLAVMAQASYIYTLHSTTKQAWASIYVLLVFYLLLKPGRPGPGLVTLLFILTLGLVGYHYTLSMIYMGIMIASMLLYGVIYREGRARSMILLEAKVLFIAWILWYVIVSQNLLVFLASNLQALLSLSIRGYYTPLSLLRPISSPAAMLNEQAKTLLNLIILGSVILGAYYGSGIIRERNRYIALLTKIAMLSLIVFLVLEVAKLSSIGTGRIAYIHLLVLSPYFVPGAAAVLAMLRERRIRGIRVTLDNLRQWLPVAAASLIVCLRLIAVLDIPVYYASFATGPGPLRELTNPFYNEHALIRASIDPATLWTLDLIAGYIEEKSVIGGDISLYNTESYAAHSYLLKTHTIYTYFDPAFFNKTLIGVIEKADYIVLTRYNTESGNIIGAIKHVIPTEEVEKTLRKRYNLVINTGRSRVYV